MITQHMPVRPQVAEMSPAAGVFVPRQMATTAPGPVADLLTVGRWCQAVRPSSRGGGRRLECAMTDRSVTIYEVLPPREGCPGRESWRRDAIARLRFEDESGSWSLHWPSGRQFRRDPEIAETTDVRVLLSVVDSEPYAA